MKIAIPYQNGQVFPHFGHAPQFKFYTIESGMILHTEVVETAGSGHNQAVRRCQRRRRQGRAGAAGRKARP